MAEIAIAAAISAAVSAAAYTINYALQPEPKPIEKGKIIGDLLIQNSAYGVVIPEILGARNSTDNLGGVRVAGNVIWTSGVRKKVTTTSSQGGGGKGGGSRSQDVQTTSYDMDIAVLVGKGPLNVLAMWANADLIYDNRATNTGITGVYDPDADPDPDYDPVFLPDPIEVYDAPTTRYGFHPVPNSRGETTGTLVAGQYANVAIYAGTADQLPDPTIEAAKGVGNVPAYRNRCYVVLKNFDLSRYGTVPTFTFLVEHQTKKTLRQVAEHLCERGGLTSSQYDMSLLPAVEVRGYVFVGSGRTAPRDGLELLGKVFAADFYEGNGKVNGVERNTAPAMTIPEHDLGAVEGSQGGTDGAQLPPLIDIRRRYTYELPRRIDYKFFDASRDGAPNSVGYERTTVKGEQRLTVDVPITLASDDARKFAVRDIEQAYLEQQSYVFTVPHTYHALRPAQVIDVERTGITHRLRIGQIDGAIPGALQITGVAADSDSFDQVISAGSAGSYATPTPPVPATGLVTLMDVPLLRDRETEPGMYAAATARNGFEYRRSKLYVDRGAGPVEITQFTDPAIMGRMVNTLGSFVGAGTDNTNTITVDLFYGSLESKTAAEVDAGANPICVGGEVLQFETATQVAGFPNRWTLSNLRRGKRCTEDQIAAHVADERFVFLNEAVHFIKMEPSTEQNVARDYWLVTEGQAIADAGKTTFTWSGECLKTWDAPSLSLALENQKLKHSWVAITVDGCYVTKGLRYEIAEDSAGSPGTIIWQGLVTEFVADPPTGSRTIKRHLRVATDYSASAWVNNTITIGAPPAPTLSKTVVNDSTILVTITPDGATNLGNIKRTVLEVASDSGFTSITQIFDVAGQVNQVTVQGTNNSVHIRARYQDDFGDGTNSSTLTHTFTAVAAALTAEESDGAPTETPTTKLIFPKNTLSEPAVGQVRYKPQHALIFDFDGDGAVLQTTIDDAQLDELPWDCTILKWRLLEASKTPIAATATVDLYTDTYANYPPVAADSITGTGTKPNLSGPATKNESTTFTNWGTTSLTKGDVLRASLTAVTLAKKLKLILTVEEL